jgi:tRNA-specific 2-thiouridylase
MKVAVGISGGVDSAVAALMLREAGHEIVGVTMTLGRNGESEEVKEAFAVADFLKIPLEVVDFSSEWKREVLCYIKETYLSGKTPNPCVRCNEMVKMNLLPRFAFSKGADFFATGHYAKIKDGAIYRAQDKKKDQSYFLYRVDADILKRTILPLGDITKEKVREIALAHGIKSAKKGDSQDFCGGDVLEIVGEGDRVGDIVTQDGKVLGKHTGFWRYTVGKRKGLGIGGGTPYYVISLDAENNRVIVGPRDESVTQSFTVGDVVPKDFPKEGIFTVKVRSAGEPKGPVKVVRLADGKVQVFCPETIGAVAPGQSAVFYDGERLVSGGVIL